MTTGYENYITNLVMKVEPHDINSLHMHCLSWVDTYGFPILLGCETLRAASMNRVFTD